MERLRIELVRMEVEHRVRVGLARASQAPDDRRRRQRPPVAAAADRHRPPRDVRHAHRQLPQLAARRELLAAEANAFLDGLFVRGLPRRLAPVTLVPTAGSGYDVRVAQVDALVEEVIHMGLACPTLDAEVPDPETGAVLAVAQAFWADGLQAGQGAPVVLELDPGSADRSRFAELGYEVFDSVDALRRYVQRRNEMASGDRDVSGNRSAADEALPAGAIPRQFQAASA